MPGSPSSSSGRCRASARYPTVAKPSSARYPVPRRRSASSLAEPTGFICPASPPSPRMPSSARPVSLRQLPDGVHVRTLREIRTLDLHHFVPLEVRAGALVPTCRRDHAVPVVTSEQHGVPGLSAVQRPYQCRPAPGDRDPLEGGRPSGPGRRPEQRGRRRSRRQPRLRLRPRLRFAGSSGPRAE